MAGFPGSRTEGVAEPVRKYNHDTGEWEIVEG